MRHFVATHRKAFVSAALGGVAAGVGVFVAGATWQAAVVAGLATALGVGAPTSAVPNRKPATVRRGAG